jgi:hypothetical protein
VWRADSHVWPSVARMVATCSHPRLCQPCALMLADRVLARGVWLFTLAQSCRHETMPWTHGVCGIVRGSKLGVRTTHRQMPSCRWPYALWMGHVPRVLRRRSWRRRALLDRHTVYNVLSLVCVERTYTTRVHSARATHHRPCASRPRGRACAACVCEQRRPGGRSGDGRII